MNPLVEAIVSGRLANPDLLLAEQDRRNEPFSTGDHPLHAESVRSTERAESGRVLALANARPGVRFSLQK